MDASVREEKDLIKFLRKVSIFSKLSKADLKHLRQYLYIRKFEAGEQIFKKGYPNVIFYVLKEGSLKVYLEDKEAEIELNIIKPTEQLGAIGLFKDVKRTASVKAIEDSVLLGISKKDLTTFVSRYSSAGVSILYNLGESLSDHIISLNEKLYT
jgi:CRP-like cAMP-binding protein